MGYLSDLLSGRERMPPLGQQVVGTTPAGRPAYLNQDGSISTERQITERHPDINGGQWTNIPTIFDGRQLSADQAMRHILENQPEPRSLLDMLTTYDPATGQPLGGHGYGSPAAAVEASKANSKGVTIDPAPPWRAFWKDQR